MKPLFSTTEAAVLLDVAEHRVRYAHRAQHVPKPQTTIAGRQLYTVGDLERLCEHFGIEFSTLELERTE